MLVRRCLRSAAGSVASECERDGECARESAKTAAIARQSRGRLAPQRQWSQGNSTGHQRGWQMVVLLSLRGKKRVVAGVCSRVVRNLHETGPQWQKQQYSASCCLSSDLLGLNCEY